MAGRRRDYVNFPRDSAIWGLLPQSNDVESHNTYSFNGLGPPPAEGVRARRHAATPGRDRAEPFFKLHGEEYKKPWSIRSQYGAHPLGSGMKLSIA